MTDSFGGTKLRRWLALAVAAAVSCGALAACADNSPDSKDSDSKVDARTAEPGESVSAKKVPLLKVGILGQIPTLNPNENIAAGLYANSLGLESLLRLDQDGKLEPWLATKFEEKSDTVYEYTLRQGVKFWDGTELTSEDVKFAWDKRIERGQPFFTSLEKVEAPDKDTVVVTLKQPDASWKFTPALFYSNVFQKKFYEEDEKQFGKPGRLVMGTGPWKFDSLKPTVGMELSAYDDYWGGKPSIDRISVKSFADENAMALALRAEEIDFTPVVNAPKGFDAGAGGGTTTTVPTCATALMSMPTQTAPWDDVHVRRAVAHAIDRKDVVAATQGRAGAPLTTLISPILLSSLGSQDEVDKALDSLPSYPYDLDKAKAEMAKSKVPDGFTFDFLTNSSYASVAQVIAAQLKKIGITLKVDSVGETEYSSILVGPPAKRPLTFTESGACSPDPSWDDLFLGTLPDGKTPSTLNVANYLPPEIDKLQDEGLGTLEPKKRLEIYTAILDRVGTDVPYVPMYAEGATYGSKKYDLVDFGSYWVNQPWALNLVPK